MLFEGKISLFSLPCAQNPPGFDIALSRLAHPPLPHKLYGGITWQQTMWNHSTHCQRQPHQQSAGFRVRKTEFSTYSGSSVKDHHRWSKTGFLPPVTLKENERKGGSLLSRWGSQDTYLSLPQNGDRMIVCFPSSLVAQNQAARQNAYHFLQEYNI